MRTFHLAFPTPTQLSSQKGFSLVEMITTTVIVTIFIMGISTILVQFGVQDDGLRRGIDADLDYQLAERTLAKDLLNAAPSLNNIKLLDDNGDGFFDYYPDITPTNYSGNTQRQLTLDLARANTAEFILTDSRMGAPMMYDPTAAYEFGSPPANMDVPGTATFVSLNRNGYIDKLNPRLWATGRLLMLDTPARIRATATAKQRPRSPIFIGQISESALLPIGLNLIDRTDPANLGQTIDSPDSFFRRAPSMSGTSPVIRLKAVQIVRYTLKKSVLKPGLFDLYRQVYDRGLFQGDQIFGKNLKSIRLTRSSIFQPGFSFQIMSEKSQAFNP